MGLLPSSLDFGCLDQFDDGTGRLALPVEYHQLFQLARSFLPQIVASRTPGPDGETYVRLNPFVLAVFDRLIQDILRHIALASYGGVPPNINALSTLRPGSLEELGIPPPPLLEYYRVYNSTNGPQFRSLRLPMREEVFRNWLQVFHDTIHDTRVWISNTKTCLEFFRNLARWNWGPNGNNPGAPPYNPRDPRLPLAPSSSGPAPGLISSDDDSTVSSSSRAVIPHPVLGPGAQNTIVLYWLFPPPPVSSMTPVVPPNSPNSSSARDTAYLDPCYFAVPLLPQQDNEVRIPSTVMEESTHSDSQVKDEELDDDIRSDVATYHSTDSENSDDDMYYDGPEGTVKVDE
ncbi:hypothetical protein LXA43DRAFT_1089442 [Ganoderma leucocontextum]|nr:hypothetical protein LXA43DRAFT_1089442 [Ganoderma leucocontextum]